MYHLYSFFLTINTSVFLNVKVVHEDFPGDQWIGNHLPMQGVLLQSLPKDPTCRATKPEHQCLSPCAWAQATRSHCKEKPAHHNKESSPAHHNYRQARTAMKTQCTKKMNSLFLIVHEHHLMTVSWYILLPIIIYCLFLIFWKLEKAKYNPLCTLAWKPAGRGVVAGSLWGPRRQHTEWLPFTFTCYIERKWQLTPVSLP